MIANCRRYRGNIYYCYPEENHIKGIVVDKVSEVADIETNQIEQVPSFGVTGSSEYLSVLEN